MKGLVLVAVSALLLQGCALGALALGAGGGAAGAQYLQGGERTFTAPIEQVREATRRTLDRMDLPVYIDSPTGDGRKLMAGAADRKVEIDLENVTYNTTKMSVSVSKTDTMLKDHATEQQILETTGATLAASGATVGAAGVAR